MQIPHPEDVRFYFQFDLIEDMECFGCFLMRLLSKIIISIFELHLNDNYIFIIEIGTSILHFSLTFICAVSVPLSVEQMFFVDFLQISFDDFDCMLKKNRYLCSFSNWIPHFEWISANELSFISVSSNIEVASGNHSSIENRK